MLQTSVIIRSLLEDDTQPQVDLTGPGKRGRELQNTLQNLNSPRKWEGKDLVDYIQGSLKPNQLAGYGSPLVGVAVEVD